MSDLSNLDHRVFTGDYHEGVFSNLDSRTSYVRSWAEDTEQSARLAAELRQSQRVDARVNPVKAENRLAERNLTVESLERASVRDALGLVATLLRFTDPGVFAEQAAKVLTEAEVENLKLALSTVDEARKVLVAS